jgi:hypothetical protein
MSTQFGKCGGEVNGVKVMPISIENLEHIGRVSATHEALIRHLS